MKNSNQSSASMQMPSELIKIIQIMKDGYNMMLKWPNLIRKKKKKELKQKGKLK